MQRRYTLVQEQVEAGMWADLSLDLIDCLLHHFEGFGVLLLRGVLESLVVLWHHLDHVRLLLLLATEPASLRRRDKSAAADWSDRPRRSSRELESFGELFSDEHLT